MLPMIPMARPWITQVEKERVLRVLESGQLAAGPLVRELEASLAAFIGCRYAVATSSGTAALHAAVLALGIGPGDKVFTTPFTFIATANAILYAGAVPVFVDIDPRTYNLDPEALADAVKGHPDGKAVIVVHLYGLPAEMTAITAIARDHGLRLIEDCAQAPGASVAGRRVGSFGDVSAFSFYATKNLTTGEGGAVVTDDPAIAERARTLINHGQRERYRHDSLGYNLRLNELAAALGVGQLERLEEMNRRRRRHAAVYDERITHPEVVKPYVPPGAVHVYHHYTLRVPGREAFREHLKACGVSTDVHYPLAVTQQPLYRQASCPGPCPVAEAAARQVVSIPVHPTLSGDDVARVAEAVNAFAAVGERRAGA